MRLLSRNLLWVWMFVSSNFGLIVSRCSVEVEDPTSFNHRYQLVSPGVRYHYVDEGPSEGPLMVLLHGFPESWYTWKYQIPYLANLGFRVIAIDMIGFGQTQLDPSIERLESYTFEFSVKAIRKLVYQHILANRKGKFNLLGHDWGSFTTWAYANYFPQDLDTISTLSIPYFPPETKYISLEDLTKVLPIAGYQLALANNDPKQFDKDIVRFLNFFWRVQYPDQSRSIALSVPPGQFLLDHVYRFNYTLTDFPGSTYMNYLIEQYAEHKCIGATNWYRTRKLNFDLNSKFFGKNVTVPNLTVVGASDISAPFVNSSKPYVEDLTIKLIPNTGHWIQLSHPDLINSYIANFLKVKLGEKFPKNQ